MIARELRAQLALTKVHRGKQLFARVNAAKHCNYSKAPHQQYQLDGSISNRERLNPLK